MDVVTRLFGVSIPRRDDGRLLRGEGRYLDDIRRPGLLHVALVRSPHAHAVVRAIRTERARRMPGVVDVVTTRDLGAAGRPFPLLLPHRGLVAATWSALAGERVRFAGEAVAAVVADDVYRAIDAAAAVDVDYEPLPPVVDVEAAVRPGSPQVHAEAAGNLAMHLVQQCGDAETALRGAPHVLRERFRITRGGGQPIETRGVLAEVDETSGELRVWSSTQEPHTVRETIATVLDLPHRTIRVVAPDTGGGFGAKLNVYPEEVLVPWLARRLGRPVKWVETRREHLLSATQERDQVHDVEVGFDADGRIAGLRDRFLHDMGAYAPRGGAVPHNTSSALPGPYRIAHLRCEMLAVYTTQATVSAYRGAGQPQATFVMERIMDRIAQRLGKDPVEVRRVNMIGRDAFPYDTGLSNLLGGPVEYDSGDFTGTLDKALALADYTALRARQVEARKQGRLVGIGVGCYVELTGRGPWEGAGVRVDPEGRVTVFTGAPSQGQGHETTLAQICADTLGVPIESITVAAGDTSLIPQAIGTFASRVGVLAGSATSVAAREVREKVLRIAGHLLEAHPADLVLEDAHVTVRGSDKGVPLSTVARAAVGRGLPVAEAPGLEATHYFKAPKMTYTNGVHVAAVEVDPETGRVAIERYVVAHDCGRMINPTIVEGQIAGGLGCGIGNALLEENRYDEAGQLLSATFMDYAMPTAAVVPAPLIGHQETPTPLNPLGVKGAGESGTIPVAAVICSAIEDALAPLGVRLHEAPLTAGRLRDAVLRAERGMVRHSTDRGGKA
ncbi:MAG: xanthine dehydrogenase family protein [Candidatus Rokubacteria bacterium]|nr:xanthine dehydrogenase family protein [Candidatus Rokubacteria bacterium]